MDTEQRVKRLLDRLAKVAFPDGVYDRGHLWGLGLEVIQRKYGVNIYLSRFEPADMVLDHSESTTVTIKEAI